jgi:uncharacterized membrane protein YccC
MKLPRWDDWLFSLKAYGAGLLALYIGLAIDLQRPYWAMTTVYVAMHPLAGATTSKAVYRFCGTLIGAVAALAIVPNFSGSPELMTLAMALWTGLCLFISLQDRTPRSYIFMLAGYTAAIIGFPSVADPSAIWDTATWRVEEIFLGIGCAALVSSIVFPRSVGGALDLQIDQWLRNARGWCRDVLAGQTDDTASQAGHRLAAAAVDIDMLSTHLVYDRGVARSLVNHVREIRLRMLVLMPLLSSLGQRLRQFQDKDDLHRLRDDVIDWVELGPSATTAQTDDLRNAIEKEKAPLHRGSSWHDIMKAGLLERFGEFVDLVGDLRHLRRHVAAGGSGSLSQPLRFRLDKGVIVSRHRDLFMSSLSAATAVLAVMALSAFWIASGWADGANAVLMVAVGCSIFATADDLAPMILTFARLVLFAAVIALIYVGAVLPRVQSFEVLAMVLAPPMLIFGALAAQPATFLIGLAAGANLPSLLALQETYSTDFVASFNSSTATFLGLISAAVIARLVRSVGADWSTRRLLYLNWTTIAEAAEQRGLGDRAHFLGLMLDRAGLLAPRLSGLSATHDLVRVDPFKDIRVGLNVIDLRRARHKLGRRTTGMIDAMLTLLAGYYRDCAKSRQLLEPPADLLRAMDAALVRTSAVSEGVGKKNAMLGLAGIRCALYPDAPYAGGGDGDGPTGSAGSDRGVTASPSHEPLSEASPIRQGMHRPHDLMHFREPSGRL